MSYIVKLGKKVKKALVNTPLLKKKHYVSYVRRIERIKTDRRICAITFDDGPMMLPASPDRYDGRAMTEVLLDVLKYRDARVTFDIVGDTSENYPDRAGDIGSAAWGGVRFDHYPDIALDHMGGAVHAGELVGRMIADGHELSNHGYRHIIFGKKPFVYGKREHFNTLDDAVSDLSRLHDYIKSNFGYEMKLSRPPHYVDRIDRNFTSYDAYGVMDYQYMAASYDGGGWLPSTEEGEITAMIDVIESRLREDPDFFCGQIIFGKDGYNMAKRTPVAYALDRQLELLREYGYEILPVSELMEESPFADLSRSDISDSATFDAVAALAKTKALAFDDNTVRANDIITNYELAMLISDPKKIHAVRVSEAESRGAARSAYDIALDLARSEGKIPKNARGGDAADGNLKRIDAIIKYIEKS